MKRGKRNRIFLLLIIIGMGLIIPIFQKQKNRTAATDNKQPQQVLEAIDSSLRARERIDSALNELQIRLEKIKSIKIQ